MTLVKAFADTENNLKVIGFSNDGYEDELKAYLQRKKHNIEFLGRKPFEEIVPYLKSCLCTVVPSEWYDNIPNVILESFAYKKAVIATDFGSLPELVKNGETGLTFKYADYLDLRTKACMMFNDVHSAQNLGENGYKTIKQFYSPEVHYRKLLNLMNSLVNK